MSNRGVRASVALGVLVTCLALYAILFLPGEAREEGSTRSARPADTNAPLPLLRGIEIVGDARPEPRASATVSADPRASRFSRRCFLTRDLRTGTPVEDARVFLAQHPHAIIPAARAAATDAAGTCCLDVGPAARFVCAIARGFLPVCSPLPPGESVVELALDPGSRLAGRVVDQLGRPVVGARVVGAAPHADKLWPVVDGWLVAGAAGVIGTSDAHGRFELSGLDETTEYRLRAQAHGYVEDPRRAPATANSGGMEPTIELLASATVRVQFVDAQSRERLSGIRATVSSSVTTQVVTSVVDGAPETAERDEALWRGAYSSVTMAPRAGEWTIGDALGVEVRCSRLGYGERQVRVEAQLGEAATLEIELARSHVAPWVRVRPHAAFEGGRKFDGALWLTFKKQGEHLDKILEFRDGVADEELDLPGGSYRVLLHGARDIGGLWRPAGPDVDWTAREGAGPVVVQVSGHPIQLRVVDQNGNRVRAYRVGGRPHGADMLKWGRVWSVAPLLSDRADEPDAPFLVPGGPFEIVVEAGRNLMGYLTVNGSGDGEPLVHEVRLVEGVR